MRREYLIEITGCDDSTLIPMRMDDEERQYFEVLAQQTKNRGGGCKPVLTFKPMSKASDGELDELAEYEENRHV